ncbi:MAG: aldo/keto reductase, partial [Acidobacteria bacterium]|nr:aldo/keto reductase [Acidobacteriota bacterium]
GRKRVEGSLDLRSAAELDRTALGDQRITDLEGRVADLVLIQDRFVSYGEAMEPLDPDRLLLVELRKDSPNDREAAREYWEGIKKLAVQSDPSLGPKADRVLRLIPAYFDYIDAAAAYGRGRSQGYIGQVMKRRRSETFLATKTHNRTRDGSLRLLEESLRLLQTDHLDLWQIHNLSRMEQVEQIFAPDGAVQALLEAREQGIVRYLGVTGHADPHVLAEAIRRFPFDTILMAINAADKHHLSFVDHLLPLAVKKQMGIIGMKVPARGRILSSFAAPAPTGRPSPWYKDSASGTLDMREAVFYVLSQPVSTIIIGCDSIAQLEQNVQFAREFTPLNEQQLASLVDRTEPIHRQALFFRRWG